MLHVFKQLELGAFGEGPQTPNYTLTIEVPAPHATVWPNSDIRVWGHLLSHWVLSLISRQVLSWFLG